MRPHTRLPFLDNLVFRPGAEPRVVRRHKAHAVTLGTDKHEVSVDEPAAENVWAASDKFTRFRKR